MISRVLVAVGLLCVQAKETAESLQDELEQAKKKVDEKNNGGGSQDGSQSSQDGSQSGNYQQYMTQYAGGQGGSSGGYQQYMKKYTGGQGGYQQYMKEYAGGQGGSSGGYQQYMKKYAGGQGGGYQQYMKKYAGGSNGGSQSSDYQQYYQQYMNLNSKGSQGGYQQYMKQYAGGQGGSSGGYQKYMKQYAAKYMKDYAGSKGGSQSGDYQQYMKKYAGGQGGDYQKYMKQYAGGGQGGSQSSDSSATELLEQPAKMASELTRVEDGLHGLQGHHGYNQEADNLDGGEQPQQKSSDDYQNYVQEYAGNEANEMNYYSGNMNNKECDKEVGSAKDANTVHQLAKWYSEAKVNVHCYVPQEDVRYSLSDVHKQYKKRLHELDSTAESPLEELIEPLSNELVEKPPMDDKTQMAQKSAKTFLAKSETAQSEVAANLALFADQVNSDPVVFVGMALLGVAFACLVFFAVRHRQSSVRLPVGMLG